MYFQVWSHDRHRSVYGKHHRDADPADEAEIYARLGLRKTRQALSLRSGGSFYGQAQG
jgi:hypothetical protein